MNTVGLDTLQCSRRLNEAGVPQPQADAQAELMAEAFASFSEKLVTKNYFSEVLKARLKEHSAELEKNLTLFMVERLREQDARFDARLDERFRQRDARLQLDARFEKLEQLFQRQDERFLKQDERFAGQNKVLARIDRTLYLHTWMLGLITLVLVVPQLQAWFAPALRG